MIPATAERELARVATLYAEMFGAHPPRKRGRPRKLRHDRYGLPMLADRARGRPTANVLDRLARLETVWTWYALVCLRRDAHRQRKASDPNGYRRDSDLYPRGWTSPRHRALCDIAACVHASPVTVRDAIRTERRALARDIRFRALLPAFTHEHLTHAFLWRSEGMIFPEPVLVKLGDVFKPA